MAYTGTSIVDYLKSEGQDSSFSARKSWPPKWAYRAIRGRRHRIVRAAQAAAAERRTAASRRRGNGAQAGGTAAPAYEQARPQYDRSEALTQLEQTLAQKEQGRQEEYASPYQERIEALLAQALEREAFSYDPNADPLPAV